MKRATARLRRLLLLYGITEVESDGVLHFQGGACAGCLGPPKKNKLSHDHRHRDGLLRGLLCMNCNKALAYLRDDPATAERLSLYLYNPPAKQALGREVFGRPGRSTRKWRTKRERREALARVAARLAELGYTSHGRKR